MKSFWNGFEKRAESDTYDKANTAAELVGLGTLAVPSIKHLRGIHVPEGAAHKYELAGLGILAAPSAYKAGKWAWNKLNNKKA